MVKKAPLSIVCKSALSHAKLLPKQFVLEIILQCLVDSDAFWWWRGPLILFLFSWKHKVYGDEFVCLRLPCSVSSICNWLVNSGAAFYTTARERPFLKVVGWNNWKALCSKQSDTMLTNDLILCEEQLHTMKYAVAWKVNVWKPCRLVGKEFDLKLLFVHT